MCDADVMCCLAQVRQIGMDSPDLLDLVQNCPQGAETLIMRMLHILTENGACVRVCVRVCVSVRVRACIRLRVCMRACMCACVCACMRACVRVESQ